MNTVAIKPEFTLYTNHDLIIEMNIYYTNNIQVCNYKFYSKIFKEINFTIQTDSSFRKIYSDGYNEDKVKIILKKCIKYISPQIYLDYLLSIDDKSI